MKAYYNDSDAAVCEWTRELMAAGVITEGFVDERPIQEVEPAELLGYTRLGFFNGIGGWDYALRLAGWPDDRPVVTASLPCQPFSNAGKGRGQADKRHVWPHFFRLVRECGFECIFGEQVSAAIGKGWLDGVFGDLESEGYTCGAVVLTAAGVGAPQIRSRLYWVAVAGRAKRERQKSNNRRRKLFHPSNGGRAGRLGDADHERREAGSGSGSGSDSQSCGTGKGCEAASSVDAMLLLRESLVQHSPDARLRVRLSRNIGVGDRPVLNAWTDFALIPCRDGKVRRSPRIEPGVQPVVNGLPADVGRMWTKGYGIHPLSQKFKGRSGLLRGAGNAIVPEVAALFVRSYLETEGQQ